MTTHKNRIKHVSMQSELQKENGNQLNLTRHNLKEFQIFN